MLLSAPVPTSPRLTLVVALFVHSGREEEFERFEAAAAAVMDRHGGRIERRIRIGTPTDPGEPDEVHVVTFPDEASFERYRRDPEIAALAGLRAGAVRRTIVWRGADVGG